MTRLISRMLGYKPSAPRAPDIIVSSWRFVDESEEDEWSALELRIQKEGFSSSVLSAEQKLLHVWRWLTDAEYNLQASRKQADKLRGQQAQEMQEVEAFVGKLKEITDERVEQVEKEKRRLENELREANRTSEGESNKNEIGQMLKQEGLQNILHSSISEQVAYLLVERAGLMEEITMERERHKGLTANLTDNVKLSSPQMHRIMEQQKADFEGELKRHQELTEQAKQEMRKAHEEEMKQIRQDLQETRKTIQLLRQQNPSANQDSIQNRCQELEIKVLELTERNKIMEKALRHLENENETLIYKLSETLTECDEKESLLRNMRMKAVTASRRNSRNLSGPNSPRTELTEEKLTASADELLASEQARKLMQEQFEQLQSQLLQSGNRYEALATKYERRKHQEKAQLHKQKEQHAKELTSLKDQMRGLKQEISLTRLALGAERDYRDKIMDNMTKMTEENKELSNRLFETDETLNEKSRTLSLLSMRVSYLEKEKLQWSQQNVSTSNHRNHKRSRPSNDSMSLAVAGSSGTPLARTVPSTAINSPSTPIDSAEVLDKLSHVLTSMQASLETQGVIVTREDSSDQMNALEPIETLEAIVDSPGTSATPRTNPASRPQLLRWFSQPESFAPTIQQQQELENSPLQRSTLTTAFGARLDTLLNNIDQLRSFVVGSAGSLTLRNST